MTTNIPIFDTENLDYQFRFGDYLALSELRRMHERMPAYFQINQYAIELLVAGELHCQINLRDIHAKAPCLISLLPEFVLHFECVSDDCEVLIVSHSTQFAQDLQMTDYASRLLRNVRAEPMEQLTPLQAQTAIQYFNLMKQVAQQQGDTPLTRQAMLPLVHSYFRYLQGACKQRFERVLSSGRSEQLTDDFFGLVEHHCDSERNIQFYADQLHISPKYLANVIRATTHRTVGDWIDSYTLLHAKTLLTTSNLTIQQIAEQLHFANQSHFGTWFRRLNNGIAPKDFRKL